MVKNFRPGYSGNPAGRPKLSAELNTLRKEKTETICSLINKYMDMPSGDIKHLVEDLDSDEPADYNLMIPALEVSIARCMYSALSTGDFKALDFLMNRMIGRVKIEVVTNTQPIGGIKTPGKAYTIPPRETDVNA